MFSGHKGHVAIGSGFQQARFDVGMADGGNLSRHLQKGLTAGRIGAILPTATALIENLQLNLSPKSWMDRRINGSRFPGP